MPYPSKPYVRHPLGAQAAVGGTGLLAAAGRLVTRRRLLALLPVAVGTAIVTQPTLMERLLLHIICFIGSLFEPYDSILPKKSFLKFFIRAVQKGKRDYDVKHGLVTPPFQPFPVCPRGHFAASDAITPRTRVTARRFPSTTRPSWTATMSQPWRRMGRWRWSTRLLARTASRRLLGTRRRLTPTNPSRQSGLIDDVYTFTAVCAHRRSDLLGARPIICSVHDQRVI